MVLSQVACDKTDNDTDLSHFLLHSFTTACAFSFQSCNSDIFRIQANSRTNTLSFIIRLKFLTVYNEKYKKNLKNIYTEIKTKQRIPHVRRDIFRVQNKANQIKAKMCTGRRHVPLCPASANEKYIVKVQYYNTMLSSVFIWLLFPTRLTQPYNHKRQKLKETKETKGLQRRVRSTIRVSHN